MTATVGGTARVFGVGNPFWDPLYPFLDEKSLKKMQQVFYGHTKGDCWWGEYEGDLQIMRIESALGPRLKIEIVPSYVGHNIIKVTDKRKFIRAGVSSVTLGTPPMWSVPANPQVKVGTRWEQNAKDKNVTKEPVQSKGKRRGRGYGRDTSTRDASLRSGQNRSSSPKDVAESKELGGSGSTSSNIHSQDEQTSPQPRKVEEESHNDSGVVPEIFRQGLTSDSREASHDKKVS